MHARDAFYLNLLPVVSDGKYDWKQSIRFALSAEEIGLLVNQFPHYKVEFSRVSSIRGDGE